MSKDEHPIDPLAGELLWGDWLFLPERLAIHRPSRCGLVSDLHLGYYQARNLRGDAVPEVSIAEELEPLRLALDRHGINQWRCAGDLFEKGGDPTCLEELTQWMNQTGKTLEAIVPGNHDRKGPWLTMDLPWEPDGFALGDWWVHHGDRSPPNKEKQITGHYHPVIPRKKGPRNPCFLLSENHIVLAAYSKEVAGVAAWKQFAGPRWRCFALGPKNCVDLGTMDEVYKWAHEWNR